MTGGATGGTYCQVGPRGVARVAPLSDSTHKRGGGQNISSVSKLGQRENNKKKKERKEVRAYTADDIPFLFFFFYQFRFPRQR